MKTQVTSGALHYSFYFCLHLEIFQNSKTVLKDSYQYAPDKIYVSGTSLVAQGLRIHFATQGPAQKTKIPHGAEYLSLEPLTTEAHML